MKAKHTRVFLGKLDFQILKPETFTEGGFAYISLQDMYKRAFHKKHLQAYLKGQERFRFGKNAKREPMWYEVMFKLELVPDAE